MTSTSYFKEKTRFIIDYHRRPETEGLLKKLYANFLTVQSFKAENVFKFNHKNPSNFFPFEKVYVGISATNTTFEMKQYEKSKLIVCYKSCLNFYLELCTEVKKRFCFEDNIFKLIEIVEPSVAQSYEVKSLLPIIKEFPVLSDLVDVRCLDNEWKEHAHNLMVSNEADIYWKKVFRLKNAVGK